MSIGSTPPNNWSQITSDLEKASKEAGSLEELNLRIQKLFKERSVPKETEIDSSILQRLNAIERDSRYSIKALLLENTLFEKVGKENPQEWEDLEKKFQLLRAKYPDEFRETIDELKGKYNFETEPLTVQELLLHIYKSIPDLNISDIFFSLRDDIDAFYSVFLYNFYNSLAEKARKKLSKDPVIGLRDKSPEIQAKFLEGRSQQIASVKDQFLRGVSFEKIFKDSCRWRSDLAYECLEVHNLYLSIRAFGRVRTTGLVSGFEASKAPPELIKKCEDLIKEKTDAEDNWAFEDDNWAFPDWVKQTTSVGYFTAPKELRQRTISGEIHREAIPLTRLNILGRTQERFEEMSHRFHEMELGRFPGLRHRHSWTHTDHTYIGLCMTHMESLYKNLLEKQDPNEKLETIARIHWWGCQACPCERGSAAIMEAICQGLLEGADLPYRLNPDKPADIYALTEPDENQFVKDYVKLLIRQHAAK
jgi:hypothetical protein